MQPDQEEVLNLIVRWEEARAQGQDLAAEELCDDCPNLLSAFRRQVEKLGEVAWLGGPIDADLTGSPDSPPPHPDADLPRLLASRYRLDVLLGEGGFGRVYRAFDTWLEPPGGRESPPRRQARYRRRGRPVPPRSPQGRPVATPQHRSGP